MIFVGSPFVGSLVAKAASDKLTPVVLELGVFLCVVFMLYLVICRRQYCDSSC